MRMGGVSCFRRPSADGDHTHALVEAQGHSFPSNLLALLGNGRAWNCLVQKSSAVGVRFGAEGSRRVSEFIEGVRHFLELPFRPGATAHPRPSEPALIRASTFWAIPR